MKDSQVIQTCQAQRRGVNWSGWRDCSHLQNYGRASTSNFWPVRANRLSSAWRQDVLAREIELNDYIRLLEKAVGRGMLN